MGILARLRLAKIRTMARPNSPDHDMPPKRTKKVRLGIIKGLTVPSVTLIPLLKTSVDARFFEIFN